MFGTLLTGEKPPSLREQVRGWTRDIKKQMRTLDRDIENIKREELKLQKEIKKMKDASPSSLRIMAKSIVKARHARSQILENKTRLNSVSLTLETMASQMRVAQTMQSSTQLMKQMNAVMRVPQMREIGMNMSKEMMRAGLIEEAMADAMDLDDETIEEEADEEVNKLVDEIMTGAITSAGEVSSKKLEKQKEDEEKEENELISRLANLQ